MEKMKSAHRRNIRYAETAQREKLKEEGVEHIPFRRGEEQSLARKTFGKPLTLEEFEKAEEAIGKAAVTGGKAVVKGGKAVAAYVKPIIVGKPLTEAEKRRQQELRAAYEEAKQRERIYQARMAGREAGRVRPQRELSLKDLGRSSLQAERYEAKKSPKTNIGRMERPAVSAPRPKIVVVTQPVRRSYTPVDNPSGNFLVNLGGMGGGSPVPKKVVRTRLNDDPTGAGAYW
jgi:hypothetical protein